MNLNVRINSHQDTLLEQASKKTGLPKSEYVRKMLFEPSNLNRINFYENVFQQLETINKYLLENEKNMSIAINLIYKFMCVDIGNETAKEIGSKVKKLFSEDKKNGK